MAELICLVFMLALFATSVEPAATPQPEKIFLLVGQSNMVGHGGMKKGPGGDYWDGYVPPQCQPNPEIVMFGANNVWSEAKEPLHRGIHPQNQSVTGIGPGMPFARHLLELNPKFGTIGLVPCACDWTDMPAWARGSKLYRYLTARGHESLRSGGRIDGLLWWQGGKDAYDLKKAVKYKGRLLQFFLDIRADLGMPDLPILMVLIPEKSAAPHANIVRDAQLSISIPRLVRLNMKKMPVGPDGQHVTSEEQVKVGGKLAEAYCSAGYC